MKARLDQGGDDPVVFDSIEEALDEIRGGRLVVVVDDADRENEGDLIMAAEKVTPDRIAFMVRHTSGVICMPVTGERLDELRTSLMVTSATDTQGTAFTVSGRRAPGDHHGHLCLRSRPDDPGDHRPLNGADDLARPGHVFPLRYREGGVLKRAGHTEAAVDLARLAGLEPAGVLCEVVNDDGTMARLPDLREFADRHGLKLISIADLIRYRRTREKLVRRVAEATIPTEHGAFRTFAYESLVDGGVHVAMTLGRSGGRRSACWSACTPSA